MMMSLCALEEDVERKELYQQVVGELKGELVIQCIKGVPRFITISELQVLLSLFWLPFSRLCGLISPFHLLQSICGI